MRNTYWIAVRIVEEGRYHVKAWCAFNLSNYYLILSDYHHILSDYHHILSDCQPTKKKVLYFAVLHLTGNC